MGKRLADLEGSAGSSEDERQEAIRQRLKEMQEGGEDYPPGMHTRPDLEWDKDKKTGKWSYRPKGSKGNWNPYGAR